MAFPEFPEKDSSNSSKSLVTGILESPETGGAKPPAFPVIEPQAGTVRLLLSAPASQALADAGESCFVIVSRATWPEDPKRFVIILAPCPLDIARQAEGVLLGTHTGRRVKAAEGASKRHSGAFSPCPPPTQPTPSKESVPLYLTAG
jgi:hypothetical protein